MPLNNQAADLLKTLSAAGAKPFHQMTPAECRNAFDALCISQPASRATIFSAVDLTIDDSDRKIPIRVYTPLGEGPFPILMYFHGGGWVFGSLDAYDIICRELCGGTGAVVVSVGYRLAPECKFPAATDDCLAATRWAGEHAIEIGGDAQRIAVSGDSAGGNLAAVTALRIRDEGGPQLCAQHLVYPVTNCAGLPSTSMVENAQGYLLEKADMDWFFGHYLNSPSDGYHSNCSPMLAKSLAGLPATLVQTMEFDPLRDEGEMFAKALERADVMVAHTRYEGAIHGTLCFATSFSQGRALMDESILWLREQFRR
ncbi:MULTISPECIES: alpha/beta hydrolase [unclassified Methylibium]|uniref:alpha/beta hydrolase n=1 Tax=unclassified Methylibium TaxID=2633235 RepID=UPI0003F42F28|nr:MULTISPECIES: alpha/beta hydrolase [unclassified Methylibium]EWS53972.1 Carboxylesterase NlhH [Methylibium sp. T29]EWS58287.1 Carboxylesterase NlhH [Methylibium sp. T29-B]